MRGPSYFVRFFYGLTACVCLFVGLAVTNQVFASKATVPVSTSENPARLLSAFFGLDNALPFLANRLCLGSWGDDGMPVVLSHTVNPDTLQPDDFQVTTRSGAVSVPDCVTLRPAQDPGELRTVLLIGEFGDAQSDPPASVKVVNDLLSDGSPTINFRDASVDVIPLGAGPTLVFAQVVPKSLWGTQTRGTSCPAGVEQIVRVTWAGGVRLPTGDELADAQRKLYRVSIVKADGSSELVTPAALADLADRDNNHLLCLDTLARVVSVSFPGGHLVDPNKDLNPDTSVELTGVIN